MLITQNLLHKLVRMFKCLLILFLFITLLHHIFKCRWYCWRHRLGLNEIKFLHSCITNIGTYFIGIFYLFIVSYFIIVLSFGHSLSNIKFEDLVGLCCWFCSRNCCCCCRRRTVCSRSRICRVRLCCILKSVLLWKLYNLNIFNS